jgi:single-strand DNA-binding protein
MISEPVITISGNLTADPELRYTPAGTAAATFNVASNPRVRDSTGNWADGEPVFYRVTTWRDAAENVAESLRRGDPVLVVGRIRANVWEDREGNKRRDNVITADSVAVPLDRHRVRLVKVTRERAAEPASEPQEPAESEPGATATPAAPNGSPARSEPQAADAGSGSRTRRGRA